PSKNIEVVNFTEIEEQGREAWYRHLQQTWKPKFVLRDKSITNENFTTAKQRLNFRKHPLKAPLLNVESQSSSEQCRVQLENVCDVFLVYDDDSCRDQPDEDELTQDYPESLHKPLKKITNARDGNSRQDLEPKGCKENDQQQSNGSLSETSLSAAGMK
ncbi:unnamed protein product, partial [Anisakis simplex]|uniref:MELPH protein n=1 Tax=Anisakis simplex TaxID=6269 RepID=A0A0M3K8C1_ANISI